MSLTLSRMVLSASCLNSIFVMLAGPRTPCYSYVDISAKLAVLTPLRRRTGRNESLDGRNPERRPRRAGLAPDLYALGNAVRARRRDPRLEVRWSRWPKQQEFGWSID